MADFHFIRPWWGLALLLLIPLYWWYRQRRQQQRSPAWLADHLSTQLFVAPAHQSQTATWWLAAMLVVSTAALAGPAWERLPQPVFELDAGHVIVIDMSLSMRATDMNPDRLSQARFKATDIVRMQQDGETGVIAYAGDAFVIAPLTNDANNILNLIPALTPEIMPVRGSNPLSGLQRAVSMLQDAGYAQGDIYWLTDGVEARDVSPLISFAQQQAHRISVLAFGTSAGAPIRQLDGTLLRDASGQVVVPKLTAAPLARVAEATGGVYLAATADSDDVTRLLNQAELTRAQRDADNARELQGDQWLDRGPWVALLLLPLALWPWRRGHWLLTCAGVSMMLSIAPPAAAQTSTSSSDWWQTNEQQAQQALERGDYEQAATLSDNPLRRGEAQYRLENYEAALAEFSAIAGPEGAYNQGNALVKLGEYDAAIEAFQRALAARPNWSEARDNLALAEAMKQQAQQQNQEQAGEGEQNQSESAQGEQQNSGANSAQDEGGTNQEAAEQPNSEAPPQTQQSEEEAGADAESDPTAADAAEAEADTNNEGKPSDVGELPNNAELTPEQQREFEQLMRRLPNDPAFLLKQKLRLEYQRRQQQRQPAGVENEW